MTGPKLSLAFLAGLAALPAGPAAAGPLPVAPPPREVRPDGSRDPAPDAGKAEDPAEIVNRIIAAAKQASDKLAMTDAGEGTRSTQAGILKDIDALLNPPDSPPQGGGGGGDMNKQDKQDKSDGAKDEKKDNGTDGMPNAKDGMGGKGGKGAGMPDMKDGTGGKGGGGANDGTGGAGGSGPPKEGQAGGGRRPRQGGSPPGGATAGKAGEPPPAPGGAAKAGPPKAPAGVAAAPPDGKSDRPPPPLQAQSPLADEVAKEVWGHLPERLRQQMSQYYREEFMPRYAGLLRQYYSSLANTPAGPPPPR